MRNDKLLSGRYIYMYCIMGDDGWEDKNFYANNSSSPYHTNDDKQCGWNEKNDCTHYIFDLTSVNVPNHLTIRDNYQNLISAYLFTQFLFFYGHQSNLPALRNGKMHQKIICLGVDIAVIKTFVYRGIFLLNCLLKTALKVGRGEWGGGEGKREKEKGGWQRRTERWGVKVKEE